MQQITTLQNRVKSAESRADEYESEKAELEQDSTELRQRAATLSDELEKVKAESSIKISEYKRSASQEWTLQMKSIKNNLLIKKLNSKQSR